jgi:hypothetical protein
MHHLDSDRSVQRKVNATIDDRHAATAYFAINLIPVKKNPTHAKAPNQMQMQNVQLAINTT